MALRGKSMEQGPEWHKTLTARVDKLSEQLEKMQTEMDSMRRELSGLQRWKDAALSLIRQLLVLVHPDQHPTIPAELREDLDQSTS